MPRWPHALAGGHLTRAAARPHGGFTALLADAPAQARYDLRTVCLPRQLAWVRALVDGSGDGM